MRWLTPRRVVPAATLKTDFIQGAQGAIDAAAGRAYQIQWIAKVQVGNVNRASQASGYSDFSADIIEAPLAAALPVVLSHGPANSLYLKYWRVWADLK